MEEDKETYWYIHLDAPNCQVLENYIPEGPNILDPFDETAIFSQRSHSIGSNVYRASQYQQTLLCN